MHKLTTCMQVCDWLRDNVGMIMLLQTEYKPGENLSKRDEANVKTIKRMLDNIDAVRGALSVVCWNRGEDFSVSDGKYYWKMSPGKRNLALITTLGVAVQFLTCRLDTLHNKLQEGVRGYA